MDEVDHLDDSMVLPQVVKKGEIVVDVLERNKAEKSEYSTE